MLRSYGVPGAPLSHPCTLASGTLAPIRGVPRGILAPFAGCTLASCLLILLCLSVNGRAPCTVGFQRCRAPCMTVGGCRGVAPLPVGLPWSAPARLALPGRVCPVNTG